MSAGTRDAQEFRDALLGAIHDVAERAAEADDGVEARIVEAGEVGDVGLDTFGDPTLQSGKLDAFPVQLQLPCRDVGDDDVGAESRELDREPGPRP